MLFRVSVGCCRRVCCVACWLLFVARCVLFRVIVGCGLTCGVCCLVRRCLLFVVCDCDALFAVHCLLCVSWCLVFGVCLLCVVWCLLG